MTIRRLRNQEQRGGMLSSPLGWGWNDPSAIPPPGLATMQRAGVAVTPQTSLQVDVVHTALRVLSNALIRMRDLRAYRWDIDKDGNPFRRWMKTQPGILTNTFGSMFQYDGRKRTVISMGLFGEAFWLVLARDYLQFPTAIEVLHPAFLTVDIDKNTGKTVYTYGIGANRKELPASDVIHIPFMAVPGALRGLSSLEYAGIQYALALAAMEYGQRWFSQGASPSFVFTTESKLGQDEVRRIAEKLLVEHSGLQSSHLPLVVDSGLKPQKISSTPDEAQYLKTLEYSRNVIGAWFGLPPHLIGGLNEKGNVWGKTIEEQGYQLDDYTMSGYTIPLEEAHSSLLPRHQFAGWDEARTVRAPAADQARLTEADRTTGVRTINEVRVQRYGLPPIEGGDDLLTPLNSNTSPGVGEVFAEEIADDLGVPVPAPDDPAA